MRGERFVASSAVGGLRMAKHHEGGLPFVLGVGDRRRGDTVGQMGEGTEPTADLTDG